MEHETAELAVAVTALRVETVERLQAMLAGRSNSSSAFPAAEIALDGWIDRTVPMHPAVEVEDRYRAVLRDNRARDAAAGRTLDGAHLSDLSVSHGGKGIAAADASTGEQKALLIGLVLAQAGLIAAMSGVAPVLLLDEVIAHLDPSRRVALYAELDMLGAQTWMTGADAAAFAELEYGSEMFEVSGRPSNKTRSVMRAAYYEQNGAAREVLQVGRYGDVESGSRRGARAVAGLRCQPVRREEPGRIDRKIAFSRVIPHSDGAGEIDGVGEGVLASSSVSASGSGTGNGAVRSEPPPNRSCCRRDRPCHCRPMSRWKPVPA